MCPSSRCLILTSARRSEDQIVREIYSRKPKWWARATWPLLLGITVWSAVGAETAFNHWTRRTERNSDESKKNQTAVDAESPSSKAAQWELRPLYQRVLMSASILGFGIGLGTIFLSARSRIVRRLLAVSRHPEPLVPPKLPQSVGSHDKKQIPFQYLVVETVVNTPGKGKVFAKDDCKLCSGRDNTEMLLKVPSDRDFWLGLEGALIDSSSVPGGVGDVRQMLLERLHGNSTPTLGKKAGGKWISGPIVEGGS